MKRRALDEAAGDGRSDDAAPGGRAFGRYRLLDEIGCGGMAVVSRARMAGPKGFTRTVVIKRILAELAQQQSFVEMLATEARLSAMLRHRAIVQVFEFGQVDGEYYLAMEFVDGVDLLDLLRACTILKVRLPPAVACHIVAEIAGALAYAHALTHDDGRPLEIVHRDVSPSNIMVTPAGEVKLLDFGIAKAASCVREDHTVTGTLKGKISYLSPEQVDGMPVDRRCDIFALGIVLHEALTMQRLFRGGSDFEAMRLIREARVVPPSTLAPRIPPELDAVVLKMLARDPAERYATCDEVVEALTPTLRALEGDASALRQFLRRIGPTARRVVAKRPADAASAPTVLSGPVRQTRAVERRPPRRWWWAAGGAAATLMAIVLWLPRSTPAPVTLPPTVLPPAVASAPELPAPAPVRPLRVPAPVERVRLVITGTPGAEVLLDDRLIGNVPVDIQVQRHPGQRRLAVQAPGTRSYVRAVAADVDISLKVTLQRLRPDPPRKKRPSQARPVIKDPFGS